MATPAGLFRRPPAGVGCATHDSPSSGLDLVGARSSCGVVRASRLALCRSQCGGARADDRVMASLLSCRRSLAFVIAVWAWYGVAVALALAVVD